MSSSFGGYRLSEFVCIPNSENFLVDKYEHSTLAIRYHGGIILAMGSPDAKNSTKVIKTPNRIMELNSFTLGAIINGDDDSQRLCEALKKQYEIHETYEHQKLSLNASVVYLQEMAHKFRYTNTNIVLASFEKDKPCLYFVKFNKIQKVSKFIATGQWATKAWAILDRFYRLDLTDNEAYELAVRCISDESSSNIRNDGSVIMYQLRSEGFEKFFDKQPEKEGRDIHSRKTKIDIKRGGCVTKAKTRSSKTLRKSSHLHIKSCKKEILAESKRQNSRFHCNGCSAKTLQLPSNEAWQHSKHLEKLGEVSSELSSSESFVSSWDSETLEAKTRLHGNKTSHSESRCSEGHSTSCNSACKAFRSWFWDENQPQFLMHLNDKEDESPPISNRCVEVVVSSPGSEDNNEEGFRLEKKDESLEHLELKPSIVQNKYMTYFESKTDSQKAFKPPISFDKCFYFSFNNSRLDDDNMNFPHQPKKIVNPRKPLLNDRMNISTLWPEKTNVLEPLQEGAALDKETGPIQK